MDKDKEKIRRKQWHEFFVRNRNRFTSSKKDAIVNNLIYVPKKEIISTRFSDEDLEKNFWVDNQNDNLMKIYEDDI